MREQLKRGLRASGIARRRAEEERAEAFFLCERRRQEADSKRDCASSSRKGARWSAS